MKNTSLRQLTIISFVLSMICSSAFACTDFSVTAADGSVVIARSMEFALDLQSNIRSSPRGRVFKTTTTNGKPGLGWTAKYGYVYLDGLNQDFAIEGMNEQGLSFEALYLPNLAEYQAAGSSKDNKILPYIRFGDWVLSNFSSVDEVRRALQNVVVVSVKIPAVGDMVFPLHFCMHDAAGNSIVVEYVAGKLNIYDNKVGVMTNDPTYDWHITNLSNYTNLKPTNPNPVVIKDMTFVATGQGNGMLGLPGDISPPSRFVKMSVFKAVIEPAADGPSTVNLAEHMINNVDIPLGLAREPTKDNYTTEYTQWTVFKDLKNKKFYYKTYANPALRMVDLTKINMDANAPMLKMPIATPNEYITDVTADFSKTTAG